MAQASQLLPTPAGPMMAQFSWAAIQSPLSDVVTESDPAPLPLGMDPRLGRQRLEIRRVDLLEQLAARLAELAKHALVVEIGHAFGDRRIDLGQAVEDAVAQPTQQPALNDADASFDFRLVPRLAASCREHRVP